MTMATPLGRRLGTGLGMPHRRGQGEVAEPLVVPEPVLLNVLRYGAGGDSGQATAGDYTLVVGIDTPAGTRAIRAASWGGAGGGSTSPGGGGGFAGADIAVMDGDIIHIVVGSTGHIGGMGARPNAGGGGMGAPDGAGYWLLGGGGYSAVFVNGVPKLIAGGGGGGSHSNSTRGGAGGGASGQHGESSSGAGGTQALAAAGDVSKGGYLRGGTAVVTYTSGGGGGYFGGDAGATTGKSGGGGSGYVAPDGVANATLTAGYYQTPANTGHADYGGNAGLGSNGPGVIGRVVIRY